MSALADLLALLDSQAYALQRLGAYKVDQMARQVIEAFKDVVVEQGAGSGVANLLLTTPEVFNVLDDATPGGVICGIDVSADDGAYLTCNAGAGVAQSDSGTDALTVGNGAPSISVYLRATTNALYHTGPVAYDLYVRTVLGRAIKVMYVATPTGDDHVLYFDTAMSTFTANMTGAGTTDGSITTSGKMAFGVLNA